MQYPSCKYAKGLPLSFEGIWKGTFSFKKWYIKGKGLNLGVKPPRRKCVSLPRAVLRTSTVSRQEPMVIGSWSRISSELAFLREDLPSSGLHRILSSMSGCI